IPISTVDHVGQERNPDPISRFENDCSFIVSGRSAIINSYNIAAAEFARQLEKLRVLVESELRTMKKRWMRRELGLWTGFRFWLEK
ncbi:MAG: hypothetical protein WBV41_07110, partial [Terriglobales bacterium]